MSDPLHRVNTDKVAICISVLEIVDNSYFYAQVQQDPLTHQATFERKNKFNNLKYQPIPSDEDCWDIQLIVNFDKDHFPFFIALNCLLSQIFLVHTQTKQRIVLVNLKKLH